MFTMTKKTFIASLTALAIVAVATFGITSPASAAKARNLALSSTNLGGSGYPIAVGMATLIDKYEPSLKISVATSGGTVENCKLMNSGDADLGFLTQATAYDAYKGQFPFNSPMKINNMFNSYFQTIHLVVLEKSPIKSYEDLRGKKVAVGPVASSNENENRKLLNALGMTYKDVDAKLMVFADAAEALQNGEIDAAFFAAGFPISTIIDIGTTHSVRLVSLTEDQVKTVEKNAPGMQRLIIPAGTYTWQKEDVIAAASAAQWGCRADLEEEVVYKLVKAILDHSDEMHKVHAAMRNFTPETAYPTVSAVPVHPGAMRYFKEKGLAK